MGKKKIQSILAMSAMVGVAPVIAHYSTEKQNNVVLESKSNPYFVNKITGEKSNQSNIKDNNKEENHITNLAVESGGTKTSGQNNTPINYAKDLQIDVTNVSIQKVTSGGTTTSTEYKPETNIPVTGTIATAGTVVNYQISVSLRSKTGKFYPVDSAYLTSTPLVQYLNKAGDSPEEKIIEQQLYYCIYKRLGELKNLNSTSTFTISASFQIDNADWNVNVKPNIVLNLKMPNGEIIKEEVKVPSIKETNQYSYNIHTLPSLVSDKNNQHIHYMNIGVVREVDGENSESPGIYNPMNQNLKSVTFRINNPDPKDVTITPLDIPELVKNANGTYTISGDLINSNKNLFKVTTITDEPLIDTISVTPVDQVTKSPLNIDSSAATVTYYSRGSVKLTQQNLGGHFTMSQTSVPGQTEQQGYIYNNNLVTYGTSISSGLPGKYNIYTGSLVTNGQIVVSNANASINLINSGDTYCHLDDNAVNILKSGTPAQKAQIMDDVISGNMSGIGTKYSASQIQEMVNLGKPIPILNFIYGEKTYNGSSLSTSESYETAPLDGNSVPVISRTITVGKLVGNYTPEEQQNMEEELKDGQLPSDGVITSNGKLQGFILSPPNKYTDSLVQSQGIDQITDTRYGSYSHGLSSAHCSGSFEVGVTIDNFGTGSSNTVNTAKGSWLGKVHQINVMIQGNGTGAPLYFNNSKITVNFGHPFKLVGPLYIGNVELTPDQYKIEGDKLIMDVNKSMQQVLSSAPDIQFNMQYTDINNFKGQLDISANVSGPGQSKGMEYEYNNITVPAEKGGMPTEQNYSTKILITNAISNSCFHMYDGLHGTNSNDLTTTLTDNVKNNNDITKQYYIVGEIPGASKDTLPNNDGEPDVGDLGSQLQSLNTGGQPTWVLPKSALNAKNQALLASPTGNDLGGALQYVERPGSGWIKYKSGMDLSNIVGYFTDAKVAPNDAYNMTYKIKLINVQNGTYQLVHSAFKYYDATDNMGSTSNIVSITTPNEINGQGWNSVVKVVGQNADTKLTPQEQKNLDEIVSKLTGHGPDLVLGTFSPTPQKLMNEVTYANDQKELAKLGYKLVSTTVNTVNRDENWFNTVGIWKNKEHTEVVFNIERIIPPKKVSTDTVKVVDESNKQIGSTVSKTGVSGTETGLKAPTIPEGYHIVNVTDNGKVITTGVPSKFTNNDQNIVYHIAKNPTTTVKEVYSNGEQVTPSVTTTNDIGAKVSTGLPELPKGYQVVKVTVNGKEVPQSEVPNIQGSKDQVIIYTIGKQPTDTIKVINEKGIQVGKTISVTGGTGSKTGLEVPTIPKGYHVVSETINGKEGTGVPSIFGNSNTNIIYNIAPNVKDETYGSIVTDTGKTLVPVTPLNQGEPGSKVTVQMPNIPEGYKIVKVIINGKEVTPNKDNKYEVTYNSNVSKEVDNNIIITVKHVPVQDTVKVMEETKVISTTTTKEGMPGENTGIQTPNIPNGYHIENITVDGKIVTTAPKTFGNNNQTVIYHLTENQANDIKADVVTESGKVLVKDTVVAKGPEGSDVTCSKTEIPSGYHLDKVLYNGKVISTITGGKVIYMLPDTIPTGKEGQLTYVVSPNVSTVSVKVTEGKQIFYNNTIKGNVGSNIIGETPTIPKGYKITNITVNGHTVSEKDLPKVYKDTPYDIVYHVTKIPTGEVKQEVVTTSGTIIEEPTVIANGEVGQDTNLKPYTPPKGYHIVKVIIDGKNTLTFNGNKLTAKEEEDVIHNLPNSITNQTQTVKYVIAKNVVKPIAQKGQITITIINSSTGQEIGNQIIYSGNVGSDTPNINNEVNNILGNKYTINNITYNGSIVTENGVPKTYSKGQNELVYNVSPKEGTLKYEIFVNGIPDGGGTLSGTPGEVAKYKLLDNKDLKLKNVTVNGVPVTGDIENYHGKYEVGGETVVYHYVYVPQTTPTGNNTPSGDVNHNGGNTTPSQGGDKGNTSNKGDNTPNKGGNTTSSHDNGDHTPSKPNKGDNTQNKGDNTPSGDVNHNGGNTTPSQSGDKGNTSNKGDNTPSKGGNTTPSHNNGDHTPSKPNKGDNTQNKGDNTPSGDVNHNGGNTTPSQSGDKGNTSNKGDNTPNKDGNTTPSHDNGDHTPSKPNKGDNTQNKGDNTPSGDVNHNGGNTTPSQSGDKGNTSNKGDNTSSKGGNTTPSHDNGDHTPSASNKGDNTPSVNKDENNGGSTKTSTSTHTEVTGGGEAHSTGTAHATVNGSGSSTSTSSSSVNGGNNNSTGTSSNTTPNVVSGGNNGNTVTPHVVVNTTSSNGSDSNGITPTVSNSTSSNGNDTTPFNSSSVSSSAGSTYTDNNLVNGPNEDNSTAQTVLPHTGLSTQNVENTAEQAGALAGIMAMLGGAFFFRRKK